MFCAIFNFQTRSSANVKTGDQSHVMIYIVGMIVSILIIAGVLIFRRKKH